ncbi:MAG: class IV adenylate cyclase [Candidatus Peregrinibacteria bacterium]|nr:class IV adenylate cyclase [Candidatus Peregrinibacteria bacterium]MDZ4245273.1 class IV adenylate cyclase [Candidatus Gracilibacteria bacterium]
MKELELKFLEVDREDLVKRLIGAGAVLKVDDILKTVYFDTPDQKIMRSGDLLRVRTFGEKIELCWKDNMRLEDGCKVYDETEVHVSDFENTVKILQSLGYVQAIYFEKKRTEYILADGSKFEIDELPGVPVFVEIEAENAARISELAREFNLEKYETSHLTGEELIKQKYGIELNGLKF